MSRKNNYAENWELIYNSFPNINFSAFDYNSIKQSLIDYIQLYFPEQFNDFIESSELISIIESFAYVCELISYRLDVVANENFLSVAQRQDSILRLAKMISYDPDRPIPNRGLVKITSIQTTETVVDVNGINLANKKISWNDQVNVNWKNQFLLVMDKILSQEFGSAQTNKFQLQNTLFEVYGLRNVNLQNGVIKYNTTTNTTSIPMELVPVTISQNNGIVEKRPTNQSQFTILHGSDGLGDSSSNTGFFCYTKQGTLTKISTTFDGVTPNQFFEPNLNNINELDVWVNNIDVITGNIIDVNGSSLLHSGSTKYGEWESINTQHSETIIFNTNSKRSKYEIETRANNKIRLIFGDGKFSDIPSGTFDIWMRQSIDQNIAISKNSVVNRIATLNYIDNQGITQTFTFTFSLVSSLQNGSSAETLDHIKRVAPSVYYTQDRMVNNADYNKFMLQDSTIAKLKSVNRTFVGDSDYMAWHDPSSSYDNVKMFGNDGILYYDNKQSSITTPFLSVDGVILNHIQPLLSSTDIFQTITSIGVSVNTYSRIFNQTNYQELYNALSVLNPGPYHIELYFNISNNSWLVWTSITPPSDIFVSGWSANYIQNPLISIVKTINTSNYSNNREYIVTHFSNRLQFSSITTKFWNTNPSNSIVNFNTLNNNRDNISILQANVDNNRSGILSDNWNFNVIGQESFTQGTSIGLPDFSKLSIIPIDINNDNIPDYINPNNLWEQKGIANILHPKIMVDLLGKTIPEIGIVITTPIPYITGTNSIEIRFVDGTIATEGVHWLEVTNTKKYQTINFGGLISLSASTLLPNDTTEYSFWIILNGATTHINFMGLQAQTFGDLITTINTLFNGSAISSIVDGNIKIESTISTTTSEITITNPDILALLPNYVRIDTPIVYAISNKIILTQFGGVNGISNCSYLNQYCDLSYCNSTYIESLTCIPILSSAGSLGFNNNISTILVREYVYFNRPTTLETWSVLEQSNMVMLSYINELNNSTSLITRLPGRMNLNFAWFHYTDQFNLIDPATTNIIDTFIITRGYYTAFKNWMDNNTSKPDLPTSMDLRLTYDYLLDNKMLSDTVVLQPGIIKPIFGSRAEQSLQAKIVVIKTTTTSLTVNQIKDIVVNTIRDYFDIDYWQFGETFFFSELSTAIHNKLPNDVSSVVLVPIHPNNRFGSLYQITTQENEVLYPDISVNNITIVSSYNDAILRSTPTLTNTNLVYNVVPDTTIKDCVYIDPYCDVSYCDINYIASLTCLQV